MVQPKDPPISLRLPATVLAEADRVAKARGTKRHTVLVQLIIEGLFLDASNPAKLPNERAIKAVSDRLTGRLNAAELQTYAEKVRPRTALGEPMPDTRRPRPKGGKK